MSRIGAAGRDHNGRREPASQEESGAGSCMARLCRRCRLAPKRRSRTRWVGRPKRRSRPRRVGRTPIVIVMPAYRTSVRGSTGQHHQPAKRMARAGIEAVATFTSFHLTRSAFGAVRVTRKEDVEVHPNTRMNRTHANVAVTAPVRCAV